MNTSHGVDKDPPWKHKLYFQKNLELTLIYISSIIPCDRKYSQSEYRSTSWWFFKESVWAMSPPNFSTDDWGIWASPPETTRTPVQGGYPQYHSILSPPRRASLLVPLPLDLSTSLPPEFAHYLLCVFCVVPGIEPLCKNTANWKRLLTHLLKNNNYSVHVVLLLPWPKS